MTKHGLDGAVIHHRLGGDDDNDPLLPSRPTPSAAVDTKKRTGPGETLPSKPRAGADSQAL